MPRLRLPLALLVLLLSLLAVPAAAPAAPPGDGVPWWQDDDPGWGDEDDDAGWDDDGAEGGDGDEAPGSDEDEQVVPEPDPDPDGDGDPETTLPDPELVTTPTVKGRRAKLRRNGKAAIPRGAPKRVRAIIAAANRIVGKPYKWGGGHARLNDRGYDCSGTVSYALIRAGLLESPLVSGSFARWGRRGKGRWVTIYANRGHVYMEVAGLRLDTSAVGDPRGGRGPRWRPVIGKRPRFKTRHVRGL